MSLKLLESLDNKIFTVEMKESLEKEFNEAVDTKAKILAEKIIAQEKTEMQETFQKKIDENTRAKDKYIDYLDEKAEEYTNYLDEKAEEYTELFKKDFLDRADAYLDHAVSECLDEIKDALKLTENAAKADALSAMFKKMCETACVDVDEIISQKSYEVDEGIKTKLDKAIEENIKLKNDNRKLLKLGLITELSEGLTLRQQERFKTIAERFVGFDDPKEFAEELTKLKNEIKSEALTTEKVEESKAESRASQTKSYSSYNWEKYL